MIPPDQNRQHGRIKAGAVVDEESAALLPGNAGSDYDTFQDTKRVRQGLHERHLRMIGFAGSIGTGLFLNIGRSLAVGGPLGVLLAYGLIGLAVCSVVLCTGEMGALVPLNGSIVRWAEYFVDPALSFAVGWNQVYACLISLPAEITAGAILVQFWFTINNAIWITLFGILVLTTALLFVRVYGEVEYIAAILRIILIIGFNTMALIMTCIGSPNEESTGFKYWHTPGPFVQYLGISGPLGGFLGVWACARTAFYAYASLEGFAVVAAETRNPQKAIPLAAKRVFMRILVFYVLTLFSIGLVIPSDDPNLLRSTGTVSQSPFVIAARRAGYKAVPSIINAVALTTAWSAANNNVLHGTRYLYGLATSGHAPQIFASLNRFGVPYIAIGLHAVFICIAYLTMYSTVNAVFGLLQSMISMAALTNWLVIMITYLRFYYACKKQGIDRQKELPWATPLQPYITWASLSLLLVVALAGNPSMWLGKFDAQDFLSAYFDIPLILILYFSYKLWRRTKIKSLSELPIRKFIDIANSNSRNGTS